MKRSNPFNTLISKHWNADLGETADNTRFMRHLLETELTVANDNHTYPNATVNVRYAASTHCRPSQARIMLQTCICLRLSLTLAQCHSRDLEAPLIKLSSALCQWAARCSTQAPNED